MTVKQTNYSEAQASQLRDMYAELGNDGLDKIAETFGKTVRSVRAKLVRDGLYVAPEKTSKVKDSGPSKKELLNVIEDTGFDVSGLEGATKEALSRVLGLVRSAN